MILVSYPGADEDISAGDDAGGGSDLSLVGKFLPNGRNLLVSSPMKVVPAKSNIQTLGIQSPSENGNGT